MHSIHCAGRDIRPGKIVCVGRNYAGHARELGNPLPAEAVFFMKPASAIAAEPVAPEEPARFEAEISILIESGRPAAVALGLDLTLGAEQARLKSAGLPWERAKAFRGSAVFSPFVRYESFSDLALELDVNEVPRQRGHVSEMIFAPERLIAEIETCFGLEDGDVIMTGTPAGVGDLVAGDRLHGRVFDGSRPLVGARWTVGSFEKS